MSLNLQGWWPNSSRFQDKLKDFRKGSTQKLYQSLYTSQIFMIFIYFHIRMCVSIFLMKLQHAWFLLLGHPCIFPRPWLVANTAGWTRDTAPIDQTRRMCVCRWCLRPKYVNNTSIRSAALVNLNVVFICLYWNSLESPSPVHCCRSPLFKLPCTFIKWAAVKHNALRSYGNCNYQNVKY